VDNAVVDAVVRRPCDQVESVAIGAMLGLNVGQLGRTSSLSSPMRRLGATAPRRRGQPERGGLPVRGSRRFLELLELGLHERLQPFREILAAGDEPKVVAGFLQVPHATAAIARSKRTPQS